jgi:hypothetical protein
VRLSTRCGDVVIRPDGRIERMAGRTDQSEPWPRGALGRSGGRWLMRRDGRLTVERKGKTLWRSAGRYRFYGTPHYLETIALGRHAVAFSFSKGEFSKGELYVARFGAAERVVSRDENPIFWTSTGRLVTYDWDEGGTSLFLRTADGRLLRRLAAGVHTFTVEPDDGHSLVLVTRSGLLARMDGERLERLADVHELEEPTLELPGGGLISVFSGSAKRLLVLDSSGRRFASTPLNRWPDTARVSRDGTSLAFVVTRWSSESQPLVDVVMVLRRGARSAVEVYVRRHHGSSCGWGPALAWYGHDLLYSTTEGEVVVLDSTRARPPVDLTATVAELPGLWRYEGGAPRVSPEWAAARPG